MEQTNLGYTAVALATIAKQDIPADMRLARIIRKASSKDSNGMESQGAHLPQYVFDAQHIQSDTIRAYMEQCMMDVQDKMVRRITDSGRNIITDSDISVDSIAAYLEETDENIGRISSDKVTRWYDESVAATLCEVFCAKLGIGEQPTAEENSKVEKILNQYRDCFASMAAKKPQCNEMVGNNLLKALDMIPADAFSIRIRGVVEKAMKQADVDMMAL